MTFFSIKDRLFGKSKSHLWHLTKDHVPQFQSLTYYWQRVNTDKLLPLYIKKFYNRNKWFLTSQSANRFWPSKLKICKQLPNPDFLYRLNTNNAAHLTGFIVITSLSIWQGRFFDTPIWYFWPINEISTGFFKIDIFNDRMVFEPEWKYVIL